MRLLPSDPDIATIVARIKNGDLNLQPNFQRGEVWSDAKKQKLIDSILRQWHVPPIHVIEHKKTSRQEVLDGQQRLVAIRDFANDKLAIDGNSEPFNEAISKLDGYKYSDLSKTWKRKFDQFTLRVFRITDYKTAEPYELFYRLNQPIILTAAEQRNAFFGPARHQIKSLVDELENSKIGKDFIGFSNSRMAYDDVLSKLCLTLEKGTLQEKITAPMLTQKYRSEEGFPELLIKKVRGVIGLLSELERFITIQPKLNKATFYSWLWFLSEIVDSSGIKEQFYALGSFFSNFEELRAGFAKRDANIADKSTTPFLIDLILIYNDRSSSRVSDVSSVLVRDMVIWINLAFLSPLLEQWLITHPKIKAINAALESRGTENGEAEVFLESLMKHPAWSNRK